MGGDRLFFHARKDAGRETMRAKHDGLYRYACRENWSHDYPLNMLCFFYPWSVVVDKQKIGYQQYTHPKTNRLTKQTGPDSSNSEKENPELVRILSSVYGNFSVSFFVLRTSSNYIIYKKKRIFLYKKN